MSIEKTVRVILELAGKFRAAGVYLLVSSEQETRGCWNSTVGLLTKDYIPTAVMNLELAFYIPFPSERPSVYVIQSAGMKDKRPLQELSAVSNIHLAVWLLFLEDGRSVDSFFSDVHIPFNCRFVVAQSKDDSVELTEVYRVTASHPLTVNRCGVWRDGHPISCKGNLYDRRNSLQGLTIRAVSMDNPPYSMLEKINESYGLKGSMGSVWRVLEKRLNFSTEYQLSVERFSGSVLSNGSWNGLIGMLARREADVAITGVIMTPMRTEVVDFTLPIFLSNYRLYIREPKTVDVDWGNFLAPFHLSLWLGILVVMFVVSVLLEACHQLSRHFGSCSAERRYQPFLQDSLFHVFSAFCSQGHDISYRATSIRVLFLATHMTAVVLLSAYSAGLISSLTIENHNLPFRTFEELLDIGTYMAGVVNNSAAIGLFSETKDRLLSGIYKKLMVTDPKNFPATTLEGLRRVCFTTFTFVAQMSRVQNIRNNIPCKILDLPATTIRVNLAIAFAKGSPYRDVINYNLQRMRRAGILQKLQPPDSSEEMHTTVKSDIDDVNLGDAAPLLAVWGASVLVGVTLLVLERKARWMLMRRSYAPAQPNLQAV